MKVLLIDDNKEITDVISFYMDSQEISCTVISQGKEGLEEIRKDNYDLILLDLAMPDFTGYDIINVLKNEQLLQSKSIAVFTASNMSEEEIKELLKSGIKSVLKKPCSVQDLEETIDKFR